MKHVAGVREPIEFIGGGVDAQGRRRCLERMVATGLPASQFEDIAIRISLIPNCYDRAAKAKAMFGELGEQLIACNQNW